MGLNKGRGKLPGQMWAEMEGKLELVLVLRGGRWAVGWAVAVLAFRLGERIARQNLFSRYKCVEIQGKRLPGLEECFMGSQEQVARACWHHNGKSIRQIE